MPSQKSNTDLINMITQGKESALIPTLIENASQAVVEGSPNHMLKVDGYKKV
jgi:hypothetical protein